MELRDGLSVGIPTLNQAGFIGETIESLLNQKQPPYEIVVSDHHSTDDTAKVVQSFGDRVRYVQPPIGSGHSDQMNFTLAQLKGEWITLFSSDDIAYPNFVEVLMRGARRSPNAALVRAGWQDIDAEGKPLTKNYMLGVQTITRPPKTLTEQRYSPKVNFAAFALNRKALERAGWGPERMESLNDWALFIRIAPFGDFVYEHEIIAGYRVGHDGDKYRKRILMWLRDELRLFSTYFPEAAARLNMRDPRWIHSASRHNFLRYLCEASERFGPDERKELCEAFEPWAESVGEPERMRRFKNGERFPPFFPLNERIRIKLRPLYARLKR